MKDDAAVQTIQSKIYLIRGHRVMLDHDLADLYGVKAKALNLAVKRNIDRFPDDFMFQITGREMESLRFQIETSKAGRGGRRYLPHAFTEQGVAMLSGILNSKRAVQVNIQIMRTFTRLREMISSHKELSRKLTELEQKIESHDEHIHSLFEAIRQLMDPPLKSGVKKIGFRAKAPQ